MGDHGLRECAASPRILIVARDATAIANAIERRRPGLDLRARSPESIRKDDGLDRNVLVTFRIPEALSGHMPDVAWIQSTGAGVDGILSSPGRPPEAVVTRLHDGFGLLMADHVLARIFAWCQEIPRLERERTRRSWRHFVPRPVGGLRVVVLGAGSIGAEVSRRLIANGCRVVGVTRRGAAIDGVPNVVSHAGMAGALDGADVLVVLVPRTPETEGMVGEREFARMAAGGFVVNVSRGATIDHDALLAALDRGHLSGAALDVFDQEPLPRESPLWDREDVMISPHVAAVTAPSMVADAWIANLDRAVRGEPLLGLVDPNAGY